MDSNASNSWMKECEKLIASGDTAEALKLWREKAPNFKKSQILQLQNRLNSIQEEMDQGVMNNQSFRLERNKITNSLLRLLNDPTEKSTKPFPLPLVPIIIGILLLAIAGFGYQQFVSQDSVSPKTDIDPTPKQWTTDFSTKQGWSVKTHLRTLGDVNGDGKMDAVGMRNKGTFIALSDGSKFQAKNLWTYKFGKINGWTNDNHVRVMADVNGDGKADIVGFTKDKVFVGISSENNFNDPVEWTKEFSTDAGWSVKDHFRTLTDVNGDDKADIVGINSGGIYVGLSDGKKFLASSIWSIYFGNNNGWTNDNHVRVLGDINGDKKADIIGFTQGEVLCLFSDGNRFTSEL